MLLMRVPELKLSGFWTKQIRQTKCVKDGNVWCKLMKKKIWCKNTMMPSSSQHTTDPITLHNINTLKINYKRIQYEILTQEISCSAYTLHNKRDSHNLNYVLWLRFKIILWYSSVFQIMSQTIGKIHITNWNTNKIHK